FFDDTPTTDIYTLSLHDALPIYLGAATAVELRLTSGVVHDAEVAILSRDLRTAKIASSMLWTRVQAAAAGSLVSRLSVPTDQTRSEEHTSELQSRGHLVCRLLLE